MGVPIGTPFLNLTGRVYHNDNIMDTETKGLVKDVDKNIAEKRKEIIDESKKKKGRELAQKEIEKIDKELEKVRQLSDGMKKMKSALTISFINDKDVEIKSEMEIDEDLKKAAGISWAKRKLMKVAINATNGTRKLSYVVNGNIIITRDKDNDADTLLIGNNGKTLSGKEDKKKFVLNRTK